jgi:hypothetical protein
MSDCSASSKSGTGQEKANSKQKENKANICCNMYFLHQIKNLFANLCEYFEANMKGMNANKWCLGIS